MEILQSRAKIIAKFYVSYLYNQYSPKSILRKISAVRSLYDFLIEEDMLMDNPFEFVILPKVNQKLPKFIYPKEMIDFLDNIDTSSDLGKRNRAIFELLYGCGLRAAELINLKLNDIDYLNKTVKVLGKGSKERIVPIHDLAIQTIQNYILKARPNLAVQKLCF